MENPSSASRRAVTAAVSGAVLIMAGSNLLSRLLGFVRVQILAGYAGTDASMDAYAFSFILPDLVNHLLAGSSLSITFIPLFQALYARGDRERAWRFFSNVFTTGTVLFVGCIAAAMVFTPHLMRLAGTNINNPDHPEVFGMAVHMTRIILPAQLFFFWGALFNGAQYAHKRFLLPALAPIFYNLGIIAGGVLLYPSIGIEGFSWGVCLGAFVGNVAIQIPQCLRMGMQYRFVLDVRDADLRRYVLLTMPLVIGLGMTFSNEFFARLFGSYASGGSGNIASLDYGYKLMFLLVGVVGQGVATGTYPFLSQLAVEKRFDELNRKLASLLTRVSGLLLPATAVAIPLSASVIIVLLERGKFTAESTMLTAAVFSNYLVGSFFCAGVLVVGRAYYALGNTLFPMLSSTVVMAAVLPVYAALARSMAAPGIALASTISMALLFVVVYGAWLRKMGTRDVLLPFIRNFAVTTAVSAGGGMLCFVLVQTILTSPWLPPQRFTTHLLVCCSAGGLSLVAIFFALERLGIHDFRSIFTSLFARRKAQR